MRAQLKTILGKRKVLIPTIAVATVLVLAFLILVSRSNKPAEAAPRPIDVQVVKVEQKDVPVYNEWIGTTEGMVNADIARTGKLAGEAGGGTSRAVEQSDSSGASSVGPSAGEPD